MKERGIIFTGESVRAIIAGRKTQTRRVMTSRPEEYSDIRVEAFSPARADRNGELFASKEIFGAYSTDGEWGLACPYGAPGDRLWVRETWCRAYDLDTEQPVEPPQYLYRATEDRHVVHYEGGENQDGTERSPWRSPLLMPRLASRLTLEVVAVRVERVQEISEAGAEAEGADPIEDGEMYPDGTSNRWLSYRDGFRNGWDRINGKRPGCAWSDNPWVWVVEFRKREGTAP